MYHPIIDRLKRIAELLPTAIGGITPTGTKTINVTQNGTVTEDVTNYVNAQVNVTVPTVENCYITTTTLSTHQSTNVTLCELPSDVYAHRNDNSFSVSLVNLTPTNIGDYDEYMITVTNNPNNPVNNTYTCYGVGLRRINSTRVQPNSIYYPVNSTDDTTSLGGLCKFWISGNNLMYKSSGYYLSAGTLKIIITW